MSQTGQSCPKYTLMPKISQHGIQEIIFYRSYITFVILFDDRLTSLYENCKVKNFVKEKKCLQSVQLATLIALLLDAS